MVVELIKQLVLRADKLQVDGIIQMIQEWAREGQVLRQQAALHLLCIVVDTIGERISRYGPALLQTIIPVVEAHKRFEGAGAVNVLKDEEEEDSSEVDEGGAVAADAMDANLDENLDAQAPVAPSSAQGEAAAHDIWLQQGIFGEESHSGTADDSTNSWQVLYFAVFSFEKLELRCPALLRDPAAMPLTRLICGATALLHCHPWVRH
jgi:hypothetical protein